MDATREEHFGGCDRGALVVGNLLALPRGGCETIIYCSVPCREQLNDVQTAKQSPRRTQSTCLYKPCPSQSRSNLRGTYPRGRTAGGLEGAV
jgi:hypothetical protein